MVSPVCALLVADRAIELFGVTAAHERGCHSIRTNSTSGIHNTSSADSIRTIRRDRPGTDMISAVRR
jgi:hypothetical protein